MPNAPTTPQPLVTDSTPAAFKNMTRDQINTILSNPLIPVDVRELLKQYSNLKTNLDSLITSDHEMLKLKHRVEILATRNEPVLVLGETGTGKGQIAKALHGHRNGAFVRVNCSSLPSELIESELFGHIQGAFTGAIKNRDGKFVAAKDGTLFLDEIGDMPKDMQAKLLIALQEKVITPLGSNEEIPVNCRIIAATNKDIGKLVHDGLFREDLYFRLAIFPIKTIPLRNRTIDIHEAMDKLYDTEGKIPIEIRDKIAARQLMGNYRELEALCKRYIVFGELDQNETILRLL